MLFGKVDDMCNISSLYLKRGEERGEARGIKKGRAQGIEEGSLQNKISMIIEMDKNNIPIATIAKVSHLSVEEVEKIIRENT